MRFCCGASCAQWEVFSRTTHARGVRVRSCISDKGFTNVFSSPSPSLTPVRRSTHPPAQQARNKKEKEKSCCRLPSLLGRAPLRGAAAAARRGQNGPTVPRRASRAGPRSDKLSGASGARPPAGCPRTRGRSARSAALTRTLPRDARHAHARRMLRRSIAFLRVVLPQFSHVRPLTSDTTTGGGRAARQHHSRIMPQKIAHI